MEYLLLFVISSWSNSIRSQREYRLLFHTLELDIQEIGERSIRVGGLVQKNSIIIDGLTTNFIIEDSAS